MASVRVYRGCRTRPCDTDANGGVLRWIMARISDGGPEIGAQERPLTYSPAWGNGLVEADPGVAQPMHHELGPADRVVSGAGALHILVNGLGAEAENCGDVAVALAPGDEAQALEFAPAEMRTHALRRVIVQAPGGAERVRADEFGAEKVSRRQRPAIPDGERAGTTRLAGNVGGDGEALSQAVASAARENPAMARGQRQQRAELCPREADVRPAAGEMDRIVPGKVGGHEFGRPVARIVVEPYEAGRGLSQAGMMEQREIVEAELAHG